MKRVLFVLVAVGAIAAVTSVVSAASSQTTVRQGPEIQEYECSNALDDDFDGAVDYPSDPGCTSLTDATEAPNPPPPAPPPPPPPPPPEQFGDFTAGYWSDYTETNECGNGQIPCLAPDAIRCKKVVGSNQFREGIAGHDYRDSIKYGMQWRVCYRPYGGGITGVSYHLGDVVNTNWPWEFRGNDSGYPNHITQAHKVFIYYSFGAAECLPHIGCSNEHHGHITYTFGDSGLYGTVSRVVETVQ